MKKTIKLTIVMLMTAILSISAAINCYAAVYYVSMGFTYEPVGSQAVIYKYDDRDTDVFIPEKLNGRNVLEIGSYAFMNHTAITSVSFVDSVYLKKLGVYAFSGCTSLKSVLLPTWIEEISESVFQNCTSLVDVNIYGDIAVVPNQAFYKCTSLESVELPDNLSQIGSYAFAYCDSLCTITIPDTVTHIADNAFYKSPQITINAKVGSYAHRYALEQNIAFTSSDGYNIGDVTLSGKIDIIDATEIQKSLVQLSEFTELQYYLADTDRDGYVNVRDATQIQKFIAGISEI